MNTTARRLPLPPHGFTLIELVIAISIVTILTVIGIPSYKQYVLRANRTIAKTSLQQIAQDQESWMGDRKTYASNFGVLYNASSAATRYVDSSGNVNNNASSSTIYLITMSGSNTQDTPASCSLYGNTISYSYTLVATPYGSQTSDTGCQTLCLTSTGIRGASGVNGAASCWQR
jgi:type IV pilus assembly protein PilE